MRKPLLIASLVLLAVAGVYLALRGPRREWSTDSPVALAAYQRGLDDLMRFYREDARREFAAALAADPGFLVAKVQLVDGIADPAERKRLVEEIRNADVSRLTDRERFMVRHLLSYGDEAARQKNLTDYLASHGRDPWALSFAAADAWNRQDWARAEELYRRLLATDPNWVMAHNNLGYIAMAQGRFDEAEERFRTYAFVAPDQANPHDSLGELLILRGRYPEAHQELEAALAVRPDFCASYGNLGRLAMLENRPHDLDAVLPRAEKSCAPTVALDLRCERERWTALRAGHFAEYWTTATPACFDRQAPMDLLVFRLQLFAGRAAEAEAMLSKLREWAQQGPDRRRGKNSVSNLRLLDFEATRAAYEGRRDDAISRLLEVDRLSPYWNDSSGGLVKLGNRLLLARLRDEAGDEAEATKLREQVAAVNPAIGALEGTFLIAVPPRP